MFTMQESDSLEGEVRSAGTQSFVLKSQAAQNLIFAIETILAGGTFFGIRVESGNADEGTSQSW